MRVGNTAFFVTTLLFSLTSAIWPVPKKLSTGDEALFIDQNVHITYNGEGLEWKPHGGSPENLVDPLTYKQSVLTGGHEKLAQNNVRVIEHAVSRAFQNIYSRNFVPWKLRPRHSDFEPATQENTKRLSSLEIIETEASEDASFRPLDEKADESYSLEVTADNGAIIRASSYLGVLHALETFSQLFFKHSSGESWYTPMAPVSIVDQPEYAHRGVMLDVARNWYEVDTIKRTIDAMAWNKMNRLHLHITDSQAWPLEIPSLPLLAEKGAYHPSATYSPQDLADIFQYGVYRGVEVFLEIDMPGHIGVVDLAYDHLITAYDAQPYYWYCAEPPCGAFQMNNSKVYDFLGTLFDDLLPRLSPYSSYFHTGGDELNPNSSAIDPSVRSNSSEVIRPLLQHFLDFAHDRVREAGLTPMVWEEMVFDWDMTMGNEVVVQSWLGKGAVAKLANAGHKVIDSNYNYWYLDCGRGNWLNFANGEAFQTHYPFLDWCDPAKDWKIAYAHDPRAGLSGTAAERVLGGEVAVWSETIDGVTLDSLLWPRASAASEVLWSGRRDELGQNRSQVEAAPRLAEWRERMVARGVGAANVQMIFCTQGGPEACEYRM